MTDNEIIKALECCESQLDCVGCQCVNYCPQDINELNGLALDLINRLQAENSNLTSDLTSLKAENKNLQERNVILRGLVDTQKAENEKMREGYEEVLKGIEEAKVLVARDIAKAKAEAYKEFADRLRNLDVEISDGVISFDYRDFNNLLKELGEDNE